MTIFSKHLGGMAPLAPLWLRLWSVDIMGNLSCLAKMYILYAFLPRRDILLYSAQ